MTKLEENLVKPKYKKKQKVNAEEYIWAATQVSKRFQNINFQLDFWQIWPIGGANNTRDNI